MRVAVTGASGLIGKAIVDALLGRGDSVVAFSRRPDSSAAGRPTLIAAAWPPAAEFPDVDAVIHLAGEPVDGRWTPEKKASIRASRVDGTGELLKSINTARERPTALISASAIGYYGDRGEEILTESSEVGSSFLPDVCREWEEEAFKAEDLGMRVAVLRTGIVLAGGGGALQKMLPPYRLGLGGPMGSGRQWFSWIHLDDIVGLYLYLLDSDLEGAVNGTAPNPVRQGDFASTLGSILHRPAILPTPSFALKLAYGEFAATLFHSQRVLPEKAERRGYTFGYPTLREALVATVV